MEGGFFLVHRWTSTFEVAGAQVVDAGYEFYDYDPETGRYRTHFFNSLGPSDETGSEYHGGFNGDTDSARPGMGGPVIGPPWAAFPA